MSAEQKKKAREKAKTELELKTKIKENPNQAILNLKHKDQKIAKLCKGVLKGKVKPSKRDTFVYITKEQMEDVLFPGGFTIKETENNRYVVKELMYELLIKNTDVKIIVCSSVDDTGISRNKGKDAIRVMLWRDRVDNYSGPVYAAGKTNKSYKSVYRIKGWEERLRKKINELYIVGKTLPRCEHCGDVLVERKIKKGPKIGQTFMGCSNYPVCKPPPKVETYKEEPVSLEPPF